MASILRVRDDAGNIIDIPAIRGADGETIAKFERTTGDGTPGTDDTYTITTSRGKQYTFTVHNGKDGGLGEEDILEIVGASVADAIENAKEVFVVHFDYDAETDTASADKDQLELDEAVAAGKTIIGVDYMGYYHLIDGLRRSGYGNTYTFARLDTANGYEEGYEMYGGGVLYYQKDIEEFCGVEAHKIDTSAHADIREAVGSKAPMYDYGTDDLTAGTSELETGKLYFVYE